MEVDKNLQMEDAQKKLLLETLLEPSLQCPEDFLDAEPHPTNQTLVVFANLIYTKKITKESDAKYGERILLLGKLDGWKILITATNTAWFNGYFGAAFVNTGSQQVVVAHRGTDPSCIGALYTDAQGIFGTQYTACMNSATTFVEYIRQAIKTANDKNKHYTLAITGHSLGAWLSQTTAFSVKYLSINEDCLVKNSNDGIHAKIVGFDSPGARDILDRVKDDYYDRYAMHVLLDELDITVFLSVPNHINTCGVHLGTIFHVFIDTSSFSWIDKNTVNYTIATHAITNFVDAFKDEKLKIGEVLDWPKSIEEYNKLSEKCDDKGETVFLIEKFYRQNVVELLPESAEISKCSFRVFSNDELRVLYMLYELQKQKSEMTVLNEFVKKKLKLLEINKLFPNFDIDHHNRMITCKRGESLDVLCRRLKQLMRWMKPQFKQTVEDQIKVIPHAADFIYYAEGQSYLDSLPKCCLDFEDSIGFRDFLVSEDERVLCIFSQKRDSAFQMIRLQNIVHQIQRSEFDSRDCSIKKYTNDSHYAFVDCTQLQQLYQIYKWPLHKHYLIVVDTCSSFVNMQFCKTLIEHICSNSMKLVFIASQPLEYSSKFIKTIETDGIVHLKDLTIDSQSKIFGRNNVIITGDKAYSFQEFLGEDVSDDNIIINQILGSDGLKKFATVENYTINIKDTRPVLVNLQMPFFKLHIKTSKAFILYCVESPDIIVVMNRSLEELETQSDWEQLNGNKVIVVEGDAEVTFKETCKKNRDKTVYLLDVSGEEIYCKHVFDESFYLPRKFFHRVCIDMKMLAAKRNKDLFVICNEEENTSMSGLIENQMEREAFLKNVRIAATIKEERDIINQNSTNINIHFVKIVHSEGSHRVEWRYSHGSIDGLRPFASTKPFKPIDEQTLSQTDCNLVILTDEPGMGKTTALAMLSRYMTSPFIIHIEIKQFKQHIARIPVVLTDQNVARFLLSECCSQASGSPVHKLLEHFLESKTKSKQIIVLIDGFDELDDYVEDKDRAIEKIITLLIFLKSKPTVQIFLTVRKYLKVFLESNLSQFSTHFDEVIGEEQVRFLVKFWQTCLRLELEDSGEEQKGRLRVNAEELLRRAKKVLRTNMSSFMGVPLQLRMLAEVFRPQKNPSAQSQDLLLFKQFNINSAPELYKCFIKLKYDIYLNEKTLVRSEMDSLTEKEILDHINETHNKLGFKSFFNTFFNNFFKEIPEKLLDAMNRQGLLESKSNNGEYQFVHRTYAEYFCAQAIVSWLKKRGGNHKYPLFKEVLLPEILLLPNSKIIRLFINDTLKDVQMKEHIQKENAELISRMLLEGSVLLGNSRRESALHIAVQERNEHIIKFLLCCINTVSTDSQEAFVSFITQSDINHHTVLNVVDGHLSGQYVQNKLQGRLQILYYNYYVTEIPLTRTRDTTKDTAVFNRIMESIFQSIEGCSEDLKKRVIFASLLNRDMFKSQISRFLQKSSENASLLETVTKVLSEVSARLFKAVRDQDLNRIKALCDELDPTELKHVFLVKDIVPTKPSYPTVLHWAAHCGDLRVVKLLQKTTLVPFAELMAEVDDQCRTPLQIAAGLGKMDVVQHFVECGADVNVRDIIGKSALMYAAEKGHRSTVEYLLAHEADVSMMDTCGHFVLLMAAELGNLPLVEYLIEHNANVNCVDYTGQSALQVSAMLGHLSVVEYLVQHGAVVDYLSKVEQSALQMAAGMGHLPVVQYLVGCGAAINSISSDNPPEPSSASNLSYTALQLAAASGKLPMVEYLMQHEALPNSADFMGRTALYRAAADGHLEIVQYLIQNGADVDVGISALHIASEEGHVAIVQHLIQNGANVNAVDGDGMTALHKAAKNGNLAIVQYLIEHNADVNVVDKDEVSVVHKAAEEGFLPTVQLLFQNNASIDALDKDGLSPLHRAARGGHLQTVKYLVENGADVKLISKDGLSALYRAAKKGFTLRVPLTEEINFDVDTHFDEFVLYIADNQFRVVKYLIDIGADLNSGNQNMDILDLADVELKAKEEELLPELHRAACRGHLPTIDHLITQCGIDIETKDETGRTALHRAAESGYVSVIQFLLEKGADINSADNTGMTVLQLASYEGNFTAVECLLEKGANLHKENNAGETALSIASEFESWRIVQLLADKNADINPQGGIALSRAIESEEWQMVEYLVDKGASVHENQVKENLDKFKGLHPDYEFKEELEDLENAISGLEI